MWNIPYINKYSLWFPFCTHNSFVSTQMCCRRRHRTPSNHPMEFKQCDFMLTFIYSTSFDSYKLESNVDSNLTLRFTTHTHTYFPTRIQCVAVFLSLAFSFWFAGLWCYLFICCVLSPNEWIMSLAEDRDAGKKHESI